MKTSRQTICSIVSPRIKKATAALAAVAFLLLFSAAKEKEPEPLMPETSVYSFTMKTINGREKPLADYKGKALLIVNTASRCGFTPQYKGMEALYEKYKARGFEILAFPANNFMGQEPGTDAEIKQFCDLNYKTTFPLFSKISVKGKGMHPLYQYLTSQPGFDGAISWNFNKFLISPDGRVAARYGSRTVPEDKELIAELEKILPKK